MAHPRVFVSSTYFDLKTVRADLEFFIKERGFDPVLHERGSVPYGSTEALERYCYREIQNCDIVISIIGGRFGSRAGDSTYSISQTELKAALDLGKQVYIFIDRDVYQEYRTFVQNLDNHEGRPRWASVDNPRIFHFIHEIFGLKNNNQVCPFETSYDITSHLKEQWSGLFQRLLAEQSAGIQFAMFQELKQSIETAKSLMDIATAEAGEKDKVVAELVLSNHPLLTALRKIMNVSYRFVAEDMNELEKWFKARGFSKYEFRSSGDDHEWHKENEVNGSVETIIISSKVFDDDGKIVPMSAHSWQEDYVKRIVNRVPKSSSFGDPLDDDIPF